MKIKNRILIIGARGGLAQITSRLLLKEDPFCEIIAIDSRKRNRLIDHPRYKYICIDYKRNSFEDLFEKMKFTKVIFLSRVTLSSLSQHIVKKRQNLNIQGTQTILDLCEAYKVKKIVIMSSFHAYGALSDNPAFLAEDSLLRASEKFPEIRDLVEMDQNCKTWMFQHSGKTETVIFRPTNIVGPCLRNGITKFLTHPLSFYPIDYNPCIQLVHEYDMASILVRAVRQSFHGVYNVAPKDYLPIVDAIKIINPEAKPAIVSALSVLNNILNKTVVGVPAYLIDYLKFPCLLDNKNFIEDFGENSFKFTTHSALTSIKLKNIHRFI